MKAKFGLNIKQTCTKCNLHVYDNSAISIAFNKTVVGCLRHLFYIAHNQDIFTLYVCSMIMVFIYCKK